MTRGPALTDEDWGFGLPKPREALPAILVPARGQPSLLAHVPADEGLLSAEDVEDERELVRGAVSDGTKLAYGSDWAKFAAWCAAEDRSPLPASVETLRGYLLHLKRTPTRQTGKPAVPGSVGRALAAIGWFHRNSPGLEDYAGTNAARLRLLLKGIRRVLKVRQHGKTPLLCPQVMEAAKGIPHTLPGQRDRCLLLLGSAAGLRRSEFSDLLLSDIEFRPEGLEIRFGRRVPRATKGDQEASKDPFVIVYKAPYWGSECPVEATREWFETVGIKPGDFVTASMDGPILRPLDRYGHARAKPLADAGVALVVKKAARLLGLNETLYSGHSLRSGCATSMALEDIPVDVIRTHLRQENIKTTLGYVQRGRAYKDSAWAWVGRKASESIRLPTTA